MINFNKDEKLCMVPTYSLWQNSRILPGPIQDKKNPIFQVHFGTSMQYLSCNKFITSGINFSMTMIFQDFWMNLFKFLSFSRPWMILLKSRTFAGFQYLWEPRLSHMHPVGSILLITYILYTVKLVLHRFQYIFNRQHSITFPMSNYLHLLLILIKKWTVLAILKSKL